MKLLLLDIETSPNIAHVWGLFKQTVSISQLMESSHVMCWAAKWYGKPEMYFKSTYHCSARKMLAPIHTMLSEADAVIHYNGRRFDIPTLNKEFILHGFKPPAPFKQVDLLETAKSQFRFPSNKLDYVAQALGVGKKVSHTGHDLWVQCMAGNEKAWSLMEKYNRQDVILLEKVYNKLKPWIKVHPNHGLYEDGAPVCPNCGSYDLHRRGWARTQVQKYAKYQCQGCGKWSRVAQNELPAKDRRMIMRPDLG